MTEMRWVLSREQTPGAFSEPVETAGGLTVFARLQYREQDLGGEAPWREIPVVSEITETPKIQLVGGRRH